jgi:hypothetical protein
VIDLYLADLARELRARGVRGRSAARVLAEARDHLAELEQAHGSIDRFGPSEQIAREVAAQLATTRTFRATYAAFAALALTAAAYLVFFASINQRSGAPDLFSARHEAVGVAATIGLVLFPQIAFVAGCLALLRALRLRGVPTVSAEELLVIRRRAAVALAAGGLTALTMALWTVEYSAAAWLLLPAVLATVTLGAGVAALSSASGPQAVAEGAAGDVFDDVGFRMDPWPFAVVFALLVGALGFAGGWVAEGDPGSGLVRGAFEAAAVVACFAVLGRRLALRR